MSTRLLSDYLNTLTQKNTLTGTDKITVVDGGVLKSVNMSNLDVDLVVTGSVTAHEVTASSISALNQSNIVVEAKDDAGITAASLVLNPTINGINLETVVDITTNSYDSGSWSSATWTGDGDIGGILTFTSASDMISGFSDPNPFIRSTFTVNGIEMDAGGVGYIDDGGIITSNVNVPPPVDPTTITTFSVNFYKGASIAVDYTGIYQALNIVSNDLDIYAETNQSMQLRGDTGIELRSDTGNVRVNAFAFSAEAIQPEPQESLITVETALPGMLMTSGSEGAIDLYFYNGTEWRRVVTEVI